MLSSMCWLFLFFFFDWFSLIDFFLRLLIDYRKASFIFDSSFRLSIYFLRDYVIIFFDYAFIWLMPLDYFFRRFSIWFLSCCQHFIFHSIFFHTDDFLASFLSLLLSSFQLHWLFMPISIISFFFSDYFFLWLIFAADTFHLGFLGFHSSIFRYADKDYFGWFQLHYFDYFLHFDYFHLCVSFSRCADVCRWLFLMWGFFSAVAFDWCIAPIIAVVDAITKYFRGADCGESSMSIWYDFFAELIFYFDIFMMGRFLS